MSQTQHNKDRMRRAESWHERSLRAEPPTAAARILARRQPEPARKLASAPERVNVADGADQGGRRQQRLNAARPYRLRSTICPRSFATAISNTLFARSTAIVVRSTSASSWFVPKLPTAQGRCIAAPGGVHVNREGSLRAATRLAEHPHATAISITDGRWFRRAQPG